MKTENEKATLYQRTQDLQNQLSTLQVSGDKVVTLENKVSSLKKELETAEMCFREMNRRFNADLMQCEKEKQQYIQQVAFEIAEKVKHQQQDENNREYILELENTLQSIPPPQYQWNGVPQNSWSNGPVSTYVSAQQSDPFPCQPVDTNSSNHRHFRIDDVEDGDNIVDGFTKTRGRVFPDGEGNYRKGNSDFLLKLFYYYNFIDFKMVIY